MQVSRRFQQGLWLAAGALALTVVAFGFQSLQDDDLDGELSWLPHTPPECVPQHLAFSAAVNLQAEPFHIMRWWDQARGLPLVLRFLNRVEQIDPTRSRWTLRSAVGASLVLDVTKTREVPASLCVWEVRNDEVLGSLTLELFADGSASAGTRTIVHVDLQTAPGPGSSLPPLEVFFGQEPAARLEDDLLRLGVGIERGLVKLT